MARILVALAAGLIFGAGLTVSDMVNPARVLAFLDVAGDWDPALAFVMGGAVLPAAAAFAIARRAARPLLDANFHIPKRRDIDGRLITGALMFGIGWGLVGLCPGPAVAALAFGRWQVPAFLAAMLSGMVLSHLIFDRQRQAPGAVTANR